MSGVELVLSVLGAVIPVVQAAITVKDRSAKPKEARIRARDIAELHDDLGQTLFSNIDSTLRLYQDVVESNVDEKHRVLASNLRKSVDRTVKESRETARALYNASRDKRSKPENLRAMEDKLDECAKYLNSSLLNMTMGLSLRQFQRLGQDGSLAFVHTSTEDSEGSGITMRSDIEPIKVSYDDDPQLDWPISKGDTALLEDLFKSNENNAAPTFRPSLALLLACRERHLKVVQLCLDYSADPTITGDDGLGAIHNAIGTADNVIHEPPETIEILILLIDQGVEASAPDCTKERLRPLHRAVMTKNVSATRFLLKKNPDMVNLLDKNGKTALYHACATPNQKLALIEELVDKNANFADKPRPSMPDCDGQMITRYLDERHL